LVYADRWRLALRHIGVTSSIGKLIRIHVGTGPIRLLFPIQTGELLTAAALARQTGSSTSKVFSTILYNKYLTLFATCALLAIGVLAGAGQSQTLIAVATLSLFALAIFAVFEFKPARSIAVRIVTKIHPPLGAVASNLLSAYVDIPIGAKLKLLVYSLLFQFSEVVSCYLLFKDLGINLDFAQLIAFVQIIILASSIPISLAGVGTREGITLLLLAPFTTPEAAVAAGIAYSFFEYIWPLIMGLPWTASVGLSIMRKDSPNDTDR
jgi:uncharacterized membrane protein YbhN (UPF0104 family)